MKLYTYFRSSAAYRVRIALNLKGLSYESVYVNLLNSAHHKKDFKAINPQGLVPVLVFDSGQRLTQSTAIIEWLDETYPEVLLLPRHAGLRASVRSFCAIIANDIHPICNLRVLQYLESNLHSGQEGKTTWIQHWIHEGFSALEKSLENTPFCFGNEPNMADTYLIPQVYNAIRCSGSDLI